MKETITWDKAPLTAHVETVDREHETLIAIMNKPHDRHGGKASAEFGRPLEELGDLTRGTRSSAP